MTDEVKKDLAKVFDLDGNGRIKSYCERFEELFRQSHAVREDLKTLVSEATIEGMLSKKEVDAIKKIAKWRYDEKLQAAKEMFEALERVSHAVQADLFK